MRGIVFAVLALTNPQAGFAAGSSRVEVEVAGHVLSVYAYKPPDYVDGPLIVVFHGLGRNAEEYRDMARGMGERFKALIVAPSFEEKRFPYRKYTRGGLFRNDGSMAPRDEWTWSLVPSLVQEIRRREGRPDMAYYLIGHSAGGQFVARMSGFIQTGANRLVAANPGGYLFPTPAAPFPYGFGGLATELAGEEAMRRYLAQPLTIYLGTDDTDRDADLDKSADADRQGGNRLERGRNAFDAAHRLAERNGWSFQWRLVEAQGVGHDAAAMFDNPKCASALFGPGRKD
jgi:poly(3-hydroxybutyrate) depolymerase